MELSTPVSESTKNCQMTSWRQNNPVPPTGFLLIPSGSGGCSRFRRTRRQTDTHTHTHTHRKTENADTLETKWTHGREKKQQTQEPAECEQLFQARSRHGNSSSLQSRAYLGAIRASGTTRQQRRPLLFTRNFGKKSGLFGFRCDLWVPSIYHWV